MTVHHAADWVSANQTSLNEALDELRSRLEGKPTAIAGNARSGAAAQDETALGQLCAAFELSSFERDILLLCAGVELNGAFATAIARLPGTSHAGGRPTFALALAALGQIAHWSALAPGAPLRYWRLIELAGRGDEPLTVAPLRIEERVLHFLAGVAGLDERLAGIVTPIATSSAGDLPASHGRLSGQIAQLWATRSAGERWPPVALCGPDAAARRAVAATVCGELGLALHALDARDIPAAAVEREALARLWEREAVLSASALLIDVDDGSEPDRRRTAAAFVARAQGAIFVAAADAPPVTPAMSLPPVRFDLPMPRAAEQEHAWRQILGDATGSLNGRIGVLAAQFRLDAAAMRGAAAAAAAVTPGGEDQALGDAIWDACRAQARPRLDDLAQRIVSPATWDDLVLPTTEKETLRQIAAAVRQRSRVLEDWGFGAKIGTHGLGLSVLFAGPSGTGKTMAAEVLANELGLDLYRIDLAGVVSKYIGETEKNLRRIFDAAEYGGAILLFDEADALFGKRSEVKDSHDRYANIEVSYLLQRMESYRGLAILTTNIKGALDTAFLRRLRFSVSFPFPEAAERERIWQRVFPAATPTRGLDWEQLAQMNVAGGSIRNIALGAAFLAADEDATVQMSHIRRAAAREYAKLERAITRGELADWPENGGSPA